MGKPSFSLLTGMMFLLGQGAAHAASDARCLTRDEREPQNAYASRVHQSCDAAWSALQPRRASTGADYDAYLKRCEKPCVAEAAIPTTALVLGALLVAGGAGAAAAGGSKSTPASP